MSRVGLRVSHLSNDSDPDQCIPDSLEYSDRYRIDDDLDMAEVMDAMTLTPPKQGRRVAREDIHGYTELVSATPLQKSMQPAQILGQTPSTVIDDYPDVTSAFDKDVSMGEASDLDAEPLTQSLRYESQPAVPMMTQRAAIDSQTTTLSRDLRVKEVLHEMVRR